MTRTRARLAALAVLPLGLMAAALPEATAAAPPHIYSNPAPITIVDNANASPYPSTIAVSQLGTVTNLTVTLTGFSHTFPDDVGIVLQAPSGQALMLMDGAGTTPVTGLHLTFDDTAATVLPDSGAFASGSWKPSAYFTGDSFPAPGPLLAYNNPGPVAGGTATLASTFNGIAATGNWKLFVHDFSAGDAGSISGGWSLSVTTNAPNLTVTPGGTGTGTVTGTGISCPSDCTEQYTTGTNVALTAAAAAGSHFAGWTGACTGAGACSVTMSGDQTVGATFSLDPNTTITKRPKKTTTSTKATFSFTGTPAGTSFQCSIDHKAFTACVSSAKYKHLKKGKHTFSVRAVDAGGFADPTPATATWKVKKKHHHHH